jgi:transglutaminase-like putative cysteine protease
VFVSCCRHLNLPARYVSGYLAPKRRPSSGASESLASHAWAEVWLDGVGWQGFDVANSVRAEGRHVRVAVGLDYLDACPVRGFHRGGGGESLGVEVRVNESVTREEVKCDDRSPGERQQQEQQQQ